MHNIVNLARIDKKKAIDLLFDPNSARLVSNVQTSINNLYEMEKRYIENTKRQMIESNHLQKYL